MRECLDHQSNTQPLSVMEWEGSRSQRFKAGKAHWSPQESFYGATLIPNDSGEPTRGRRHIFVGTTDYVTPRSTIRTYDPSLMPPYSQSRPEGKKIDRFVPIPIKPRAERLHISGQREPITRDELPIGIRTFRQAFKEQTKEYFVEDKMQRKVRAPARLQNTTFYGAMPWLSRQKQCQVPHYEDFGVSRLRVKRFSDVPGLARNLNTTAGDFRSTNKLPATNRNSSRLSNNSAVR